MSHCAAPHAPLQRVPSTQGARDTEAEVYSDVCEGACAVSLLADADDAASQAPARVARRLAQLVAALAQVIRVRVHLQQRNPIESYIVSYGRYAV